MDILDKVYETLIADDYIEEKAYGKIKYYDYPAVNEFDDPQIIIDPLDAPSPADYADDYWMTYDYLLQIEVWSNNRKLLQGLADRIRESMWQLGFHQNSGTKEYDGGIFRDARRYRGKLYRDSL